MPSWIERLAWEMTCPTCDAMPTEPCRSLYDRSEREFNHPSRNQLYHVEQERRRSQERSRAGAERAPEA